MTDPLFDALDELAKRHVHGQSFAPWRDAAHAVSDLWTPEMRASYIEMKRKGKDLDEAVIAAHDAGMKAAAEIPRGLRRQVPRGV